MGRSLYPDTFLHLVCLCLVLTRHVILVVTKGFEPHFLYVEEVVVVSIGEITAFG